MDDKTIEQIEKTVQHQKAELEDLKKKLDQIQRYSQPVFSTTASKEIQEHTSGSVAPEKIVDKSGEKDQTIVKLKYRIAHLIRELEKEEKDSEKLKYRVIHLVRALDEEDHRLIPVGPLSEILFEERAQLCKSAVGKELFGIIIKKQSTLCVAADVTTKKELLDLAREIGPEICMLKTHIDIINDFDQELVKELSKIAQEHNFIIFEDRKFADIGNVVAQQYEHGVYKVASWAHVSNAHVVAGGASVSALKNVALKYNRGLLLIAGMSTADTTTNNKTAAEALSIARQNTDVIFGFICQKRFATTNNDLGFLYCAPGVHIATKGDNFGQNYNTPEYLIKEKGIDVIIVGRGITQENDKRAAAKLYREAAWKAYESRNTKKHK
eukprot:TRINITY_DN6196_c0_g1_i1.p1 TRINITY_DN6196_c0_g1~~TRINITY_DN6196_c0_g1_i1.p1  ORF type:complete len:382 (+),score=80.20 TRINITY_DN6196_c0_g1_i1:100-1245(+)